MSVTLYSDWPVVMLSNIYHPVTNPNSNTFVRVNTLIVDDSKDYLSMAVVTAVNQLDYSYTSRPIVMSKSEGESDWLLEYGERELFLYVDKQITPAKLLVDGRMYLYGNNTVGYKLRRTSTGASIALYLDADGQTLSDMVPLVATEATNIRRCAVAYTAEPLAINELVTIEFYDASNVITETRDLAVRKMTVFNDLNIAPLTEFRVESSQMVGDKWALYVGQSVSELSLQPKLVFADGSVVLIAQDDSNCHIFDLNNVEALHPGQEYTILSKFVLSDTITAVSEILEGNGTDRYVTDVNTIVILSQNKHIYSKLSMVPVYNSLTSRWTLGSLAYYKSRNAVDELSIGTDVTITEGTFDGSLLGTPQALTLEVASAAEDGSMETLTQTVVVTVNDPSSETPFLIADSVDDPTVYGLNDLDHDRPVIYFNSTTETYYIPTSKFADTDKFLHDFYEMASPPYLADTETEAPVPTHFIIREFVIGQTGRVLLPQAIPIDEFYQAMTFLTTLGTNQYVGATVIVDFLTQVDEMYTILYGVPVEVRNAP